MSDEPTYVCPIHGNVEGLLPNDGPLSNCVPRPLLCEQCDPFHEVIVGYDEEDE